MADAERGTTAQRVAALEAQVNESFAKLCRWMPTEFTLHRPPPPKRVFERSEQIQQCRWRVRHLADLAKMSDVRVRAALRTVSRSQPGRAR